MLIINQYFCWSTFHYEIFHADGKDLKEMTWDSLQNMCFRCGCWVTVSPIWDDHPQWLFWWKKVSKQQERCWFFHQVPSYSMIFHQVPSYSFISHDFPIKLLYIFNGCISPGGDADRSTSCWVWGPLEDLMKLWDKPSIYIYIYISWDAPAINIGISTNMWRL